MTILDTKIPKGEFEAVEAADGRSFFAPKSEATIEFDLAGIVPLRQEVLLFARRLAKEKRDRTVLKSCLETGFFEALKTLQSALNSDDGILRLRTNRTPIAPVEKISALNNDYVNSDGRSMDIPNPNITAVSVLAFPSFQDDYRPVVDMRVRTSSDPEPVNIPNFPVNEPLGSWFRFDLSQTVMVQLLQFD